MRPILDPTVLVLWSFTFLGDACGREMNCESIESKEHLPSLPNGGHRRAAASSDLILLVMSFEGPFQKSKKI